MDMFHTPEPGFIMFIEISRAIAQHRTFRAESQISQLCFLDVVMKALWSRLSEGKHYKKQISFQAYRKSGSADLHFTVQNISQKGKVVVNGCELGHLERVDLEDKALLRFGRYELLVLREPGESQDGFEVLFEKQNIPPSREMGMDVTFRSAVMETGMRNYQNGGPVSQEPLEFDETMFE
ncbi:hypothetical protein MHYP_G00011850 [Metynnis hypsauchen]